MLAVFLINIHEHDRLRFVFITRVRNFVFVVIFTVYFQLGFSFIAFSIGNNVVIMPPAYINTGAYIDEGTMIDSHVLVGSCAQIGKRCHISAGVQIGGVLEPINAYPCIVEDDVILGIQSAIAEGVIVKSRAVIGAGVIITASTPVYDVVKEKIYTAKNGSLIIPEGAVVIPGSRNIKGNPFAQEYGLHVATPIIKKYRDEKTDAKTALEMSLR